MPTHSSLGSIMPKLRNNCSDFGMPEAVEQLMSARLLTDMMSRLRINYELLLRRENVAIIVEATDNCTKCDRARECANWSDLNPEGEDNPLPTFCPVAGTLKRLASTSVPAWDH